ncbi:hypothetical protein GQ44DRAFT_776303 [Phaeosphaeriaceae sp. PMI808]|nr:hypothetical protein GQ44DRAFT_776303 [Phaeosphaeriaceae sp. PMI808]
MSMNTGNTVNGRPVSGRTTVRMPESNSNERPQNRNNHSQSSLSESLAALRSHSPSHSTRYSMQPFIMPSNQRVPHYSQPSQNFNHSAFSFSQPAEPGRSTPQPTFQPVPTPRRHYVSTRSFFDPGEEIHQQTNRRPVFGVPPSDDFAGTMGTEYPQTMYPDLSARAHNRMPQTPVPAMSMFQMPQTPSPITYPETFRFGGPSEPLNPQQPDNSGGYTQPNSLGSGPNMSYASVGPSDSTSSIHVSSNRNVEDMGPPRFRRLYRARGEYEDIQTARGQTATDTNRGMRPESEENTEQARLAQERTLNDSREARIRGVRARHEAQTYRNQAARTLADARDDLNLLRNEFFRHRDGRPLPAKLQFFRTLPATDPSLDPECPICHIEYNDTDHPAIRPRHVACTHVFGRDCLQAWINSGMCNAHRCPSCRQTLAGALGLQDPDIARLIPPPDYDRRPYGTVHRPPHFDTPEEQDRYRRDEARRTIALARRWRQRQANATPNPELVFSVEPNAQESGMAGLTVTDHTNPIVPAEQDAQQDLPLGRLHDHAAERLRGVRDDQESEMAGLVHRWASMIAMDRLGGGSGAIYMATYRAEREVMGVRHRRDYQALWGELEGEMARARARAGAGTGE